METLSLGAVRALNEVADAAQKAAEATKRGWVGLTWEHSPSGQVAQLARLNVAIEVCLALDIDYDQITRIADQAGMTPELVERLTDDDVVTETDRQIAEAKP
jgi:hypothetical protein